MEVIHLILKFRANRINLKNKKNTMEKKVKKHRNMMRKRKKMTKTTTMMKEMLNVSFWKEKMAMMLLLCIPSWPSFLFLLAFEWMKESQIKDNMKKRMTVDVDKSLQTMVAKVWWGDRNLHGLKSIGFEVSILFNLMSVVLPARVIQAVENEAEINQVRY